MYILHQLYLHDEHKCVSVYIVEDCFGIYGFILIVVFCDNYFLHTLFIVIAFISCILHFYPLTYPRAAVFPRHRGPAERHGQRLRQGVSSLYGLTGEHEEEDGGDHRANAQLLLPQHGWTDEERVTAGGEMWCCVVNQLLKPMSA